MHEKELPHLSEAYSTLKLVPFGLSLRSLRSGSKYLILIRLRRSTVRNSGFLEHRIPSICFCKVEMVTVQTNGPTKYTLVLMEKESRLMQKVYLCLNLESI